MIIFFTSSHSSKSITGGCDSLPKSIQEHLEEVKPKRARNKKGQLIGDDPNTPDINEAYEGGKAPKKKAKKGDKK